MAAEFITPIITKVMEFLWVPIERQFGYLVHYKSNVRHLRTEVENLDAKEMYVQKLVEAANDKGEDINPEVLNWQANLSKIKPELSTLEGEINLDKRCFHVWCPDWSSRYRLSRDAKKKTAIINTILSSGQFYCVSLPARTPGIEALPTPDFMPLESTRSPIDQIMEILRDEKNSVNIIGVHGTGGIGKTTLMKQVGKQAKKEKFFDDVAMATVSRNPNLKEIQCEIAELIGLRFEEDSVSGRAARLAMRLKKRNKVLVILDDLWTRLELEDVGIPYGSEHNGCKILVTSRSLQVCYDMETQKNIPIPALSDEDSWALFRKKAGDLIDSPALRDVAWEVVKECGGVPNLIVTVGRALRNKSHDVWVSAAQKLGEPMPPTINGVYGKVFSCLKLSYDQLESEEAKSCLLFCCLFPEYHNIGVEELVIYGLAERLFPSVETLGEAWSRMQSVVDYLKSSSLLLEGDKEGSVKVHDDVRDVTISIASKDGRTLLAKAGLRLKHWPEENLENCKRLSLMDNEITELPYEPRCPQLLTLFLQNNCLETIPGGFFNHMKSLIILDLSYTDIAKLPSSLSCLENLRSLSLENTRLREASSLKGLKKIEILNLRGSCLLRLPGGLEEMTNLRLLDISNNFYLEELSSAVISKLCRLEELYTGNSFGGWKIEQTMKLSADANFSEVASLVCLTVLHIHVKNTKSLSTNINGPWANLRKFRVCVNDDYWDIATPKSMCLKNLSYPVADWVKLLLERTEHLALTRSNDLENIIEKDVRGLNNLKSLHLRACNVNYVFRSCMLPRVEKLEELQIEYCYPLKEVFRMEEIEEEHLKASKLRDLILVGLPKLVGIWRGNASLAFLDNLQLMKVKDCGRLRNLFSPKLAQRLHQLEQLAIMACDNMEEIVSSEQVEVVMQPPAPLIFQNLQKLIISKCKRLKYLLTAALVKGLENLEELTVVSCNEMEDIIVKEKEEELKDQNLLPQLRNLTLQNLPDLPSLYKGDLLLNLASLQELHVWNCPNLKKLPLGLHSAPKLRMISGQTAWFEGLEWEDVNTKLRLQQLLTEEDLGSYV